MRVLVIPKVRRLVFFFPCAHIIKLKALFKLTDFLLSLLDFKVFLSYGFLKFFVCFSSEVEFFIESFEGWDFEFVLFNDFCFHGFELIFELFALDFFFFREFFNKFFYCVFALDEFLFVADEGFDFLFEFWNVVFKFLVVCELLTFFSTMQLPFSNNLLNLRIFLLQSFGQLTNRLGHLPPLPSILSLLLHLLLILLRTLQRRIRSPILLLNQISLNRRRQLFQHRIQPEILTCLLLGQFSWRWFFSN